MQEQYQRGTLSQLIRDRPLPHDTPGLLHEIVGQVRTIGWRGTWHDAHPFVFTRFVLIRSPRSLPAQNRHPMATTPVKSVCNVAIAISLRR